MTEKKVVESKHAAAVSDGKNKGGLVNMSVTVDTKQQELRTLRGFEASCLHIPPNLSDEGTIVLRALFDCFDRAKEVKEGLIGDLIWGFQQVTPPIAPKLTVKGLEDLRTMQFIKYQAPDNSYVDLSSDKVAKAWVRYQPTLLDMVYSGG